MSMRTRISKLDTCTRNKIIAILYKNGCAYEDVKMLVANGTLSDISEYVDMLVQCGTLADVKEYIDMEELF